MIDPIDVEIFLGAIVMKLAVVVLIVLLVAGIWLARHRLQDAWQRLLSHCRYGR